jgi:hypothetical protein
MAVAGPRGLSQIVLLIPLLLAACDPPEPGGRGVRRSAIYNGKPTSSHPMVGELDLSSDEICTATLIGKKTVLTAAHCYDKKVSTTFIAGGASYKVASFTTHPDYDDYTLDNDVGVVILASAPPLTPAIVATKAPWVGLQVTLIGYGSTTDNAEDDGVKRIATATVNTVTATGVGWSASSGGTCFGDSGGPAFATIDGQEVQVGIHSTGELPCGNSDYDMRVDAFMSWIEQTAGGDVNKGPVGDTQAPKVTIDAPIGGASVSSPVTVRATITDDVGVVKAQLSVDGQLKATRVAAPWELSATLAPGQYALQVVGLDAAGNQGSATVTVKVVAGDAGVTLADGASAPDQGFEAQPSGCAVTGGSTSAWPLVTLILGLAWRRRARRGAWRSGERRAR